MEKRSSSTALLFSIGFIFMLVCAIAAFFYGIQLGSSKVEAKYAAQRALTDEKGSAAPYQQQDLVSFYHTVFLPYREFQKEWFDAMDKLSQGQSADSAAMFKSLASLAGAKSKEAASVSASNSPLLAQAQANYIHSLDAFKEAAGKAASSAKSHTGSELIAIIEAEKNYKSAAGYALTAQQSYYSAMLKWAAYVNLDINGDYEAPESLTIEQWKSLPLINKNKLMADRLQSLNKLTAYYPHDLTSRIDLFIKAGQADKMKISTVPEIIDLLISTEAIRTGDYLANKSQLYTNDLMPLLPFFSSETK